MEIQAIATVVAVTGKAFARNANLEVRALRPGDTLLEGETILTSADSHVELSFMDGSTMDVPADHSMLIATDLVQSGWPGAEESALAAATPEDLLQALAEGKDIDTTLEAPAAGLEGGETGDGNSFVRLLRITEEVSPLTYAFESPPVTEPPVFEQGLIVEEVVLPSVSVSVSVTVPPGGEGGGGGGIVISADGHSASLIEGTDGQSTAKVVHFTIQLNQVFDQDVQVTYQIVEGTAKVGQVGPDGDYFDGPLGGTVTIPAGQTSFVVSVNIVQDHYVENDENFQIILTDAVNATINPATSTATVTIINDDLPPVAHPDAYTTNEGEDGSTVFASVLGNDTGDKNVDGTQADGETLTVTTTGPIATNAGGTVTMNPDGTFSYVPPSENFNGPDSFQYSMTDGYNGTSSATVTITVNPVNDAPVAVDDSNSISENTASITSVVPGVLGNDTDIDSSVLTVTAVRTGTEAGSGTDGTLGVALTGEHGTLTLNADGSYTYALNNGDPAVDALNVGDSLTDTFTYTMSDGSLSDQAQLVITINGTNDGPVAVDDSNSISENTASISTTELVGGVLVNDTDVDTAHNLLTVTAVRTGTEAGSGTAGTLGVALTGEHGTLTLNADGSYTYALNNGDPAVDALNVGDSLTDTFTYTMSDGSLSDQAQLVITINGTNDAPVVTPSSVTVSEEGLAWANPDLYALPTATLDSGDANVANGTISIIDPDSSSFTITLTEPATSLTSGGQTIVWTGDGTSTLVGHAGSAGGDVILTIGIDGSGAYTVTLSGQLDHAAGGGENLLSFDVGVNVNDGATTTPSSLTVTVEDDIPIVTEVTNLVYANSDNPTPGGTGVFDYSIGADSQTYADAAHSDFSTITLAGMVDGNAIASPSVTWNSEDANSAIFDISFYYPKDPATPGELTLAEGTLTFDKTAGTYTVVLDQPIESFTTLTTSAGSSYIGYVPGTATEDSSQPEVAVVTLASDFYVQFTGAAEPGSGTGANNLYTTGDGTPGAFANGDLITQASSWVSVSNTANGVGGDTLGRGEVLDFNFYSSNPHGVLGTPDATATGMFLKFDGIVSGGTANADMVVILKLVDPDDGTRTTKAIIVDSTDIYKQGDTLPAGYVVSLDNNDGVVFIESNDYNLIPGENWVIEGAQVLSSTEGITGTGINLDSSHAASTTYQEFEGTPGVLYPEADTVDNDGFKISDIGITTQVSMTEDTSLNFTFYNIDADGDATASQTLTVNIEGDSIFTGTAAADVIYGTAGHDTLNGGDGNDTLIGGGGGDTMDGGSGNDTVSYAGSPDGVTVDLSATPDGSGYLHPTGGDAAGDLIKGFENITGSSHADHLTGNDSANILTGGAGDDILTGGLGADTFVWKLGDQGSTVTPAVDTTDFNVLHGDVLNLHDLLQGEHDGTGIASSNLTQYLDFGVEGGSVVLLVDHTGGGTFEPTQKIVLENYASVDALAVDLGLSPGSNTAAILHEMIQNGNLKTDM